MAKPGRPRDEFDWDMVESLTMLDATQEFIAERLLIKELKKATKHTISAKIKLIQRRILERHGCNFVQYRDQKMEGMRIKLRQYQWKSAEKGNVTMQIWLGKQYLNQKDKSSEEIEALAKTPPPVQQINPEQWADLIRIARGGK